MPRDAVEPLPKNVAVISVSVTAKSKHFVFQKMHHSLSYHPQVEAELKQIPVKHRHVMVSLSNEQRNKYWNPETNQFHYNGIPLKEWSLDTNTLTSKLGFQIIFFKFKG